MPELLLDEEAHEYRLGDRRMDGVTSTLRSGGVCDELTWDDHALWRGSAVHKAAHFHDEGDLNEKTLSDEIRAYLEQWKKVRQAHAFEVLAIEKKVHHSGYGFAGRIDRIVRMASGPYRGKRAIIDIKTNKSGDVAPCARIQTAAYGWAESRDVGRFLWPRIAVCLMPDSYRLETYGPETYLEDFRIFSACLIVSRWRAKHL